jgi:Protein of unknown function (DUF3379)
MDCETFHERLDADPAALDAECAAHEAACSACAAYAGRLRALERLISEALRFDVAAARAGARRREPRRALSPIWVALAASIVGGLAVWIGLGYESRPNPDVLAAEVIAHWPLEPESWVITQTAVALPALEAVVAPQARVDVDRLGLISYAHLCWVDGRWIPHLVVQGQAGPVMVLLLPSEHLASAVPLELPGERLKGVVMPLGKGAVAVLGSDAEPLEPLRKRIAAAVQWTT